MYDGLYKTDDGAALRFFYDTDKNNFQSEKQGRPVYDKVLFVEVITPGSKESSPVFTLERWSGDGESAKRPVFTDEERCKRYSRQIEAFKGDIKDVDMIGTPIDKWPSVDIHIAASLRESRVYTVEALASLPDSRLGALGPGALSLRERAKAYLEQAKNNAPSEALAAENVVLKADLASAQDQIKLLSDRLDKLDGVDDGKPAVPGKPAKTTV